MKVGLCRNAGQSDRSGYGRYRDRGTTHNTHCDTRVSLHLDNYTHAHVRTITQNTRSSLLSPLCHCCHSSITHTRVTQLLKGRHTHTYTHTFTIHTHALRSRTDYTTQTLSSFARLHTRTRRHETRPLKGDRLNGGDDNSLHSRRECTQTVVQNG